MKKLISFSSSARGIYRRFLLWLLSIIGFSSIAGCQEDVRPLYGVAPEYGVPPNYKHVTIKGNVFSEKDSVPVEKIKVSCSGSAGTYWGESDSTGAYFVNFTYISYDPLVNFHLSDNNPNDGKDYVDKDSVINLYSNDFITNPTVNFFVNEKKK